MCDTINLLLRYTDEIREYTNKIIDQNFDLEPGKTHK